MKETITDILILSNGPGEVTTWVRPVVKQLRQQLVQESGNSLHIICGDGETGRQGDGAKIRISVILSPCPHATGKEANIAASYEEIDRVQGAEHFFPFLLWGKTAEDWDWSKEGVVLFLGGDQFFALVIGKRLGYQTVVYAEWEARWYRFIDRFGVMKPEIIESVPPQYRHKFTVVGDLMADITVTSKPPAVAPQEHLIGLLPGSKPAKLAQGVPLILAIAEYIHAHQANTKFMIPVAPTLEPETIAQYADPQYNRLIERLGGVSAKLVIQTSSSTLNQFLETSGGVKVELISKFPAYELLSQCSLCLTTVGANTAELGSLAVPMIVLIPTQQLDAMRAWDGIPGILANLPLFGTIFARIINWLLLRQKRLFAWPNIWAQTEIVPELVGQLQAQEVGAIVLDFLSKPDELNTIRAKLQLVRGQSGAAQKLASIVCRSIGDT